MSRADEIFIRNCRDILDNGIWDTDRPVRPKWDDGQSAHTIKKFGIINRYNLAEEFPMMAALKISVGMSWVGVIVGEYLVSKAGLGYLIVYGGQVFKLDLVMASVVVLCILAAFMYYGVAAIEKKLAR